MVPVRPRIASIPQRHPYVAHLQPTDGAGWTVLPDPPTGPWWPPARLDADWIDAHADTFDVFHVHFGFDGMSVAGIAAVCDALARQDRPLVYTVHDLRNPHHPDPMLHVQQMAAWLTHADTVLTLTPTAADQVRRSFGVEATVVAHPHVVPLDQIAPRRAARRPRPSVPRVGVHLKSLRANIDALGVLRALPSLARDVRCEVRVDVHLDVVTPGSDNHAPAVVAELGSLRRHDGITVRAHDYYDDDAFFDYLADLDVSVLPYRFGTHSGWLEACRDLEVAVVAPDCGAYADQGASATYVCNERDGLDPISLAGAVAQAITAPTPAPDVGARRDERNRVAAAHLSCYDALVAEAPLVSSA